MSYAIPRILTRAQFIEAISEKPGALFVAFTARTELARGKEMLAKTRDTRQPNPFERVTKVARVSGQLNAHFDKAVLRDLVKEGKLPEVVREWIDAGLSITDVFSNIATHGIANPFEQGTSWHTVVLDNQGRLTPFSRHKKDGSKLYLRVSRRKALESRYFADDGSEIPYEKLAPWLKDDERHENQGLESPVIFRLYGLHNVVSVAFDGAEHLIADNALEVAA